MIKEIKQENLAECVAVIRDSFATVVAEFGITEENAPPVYCLCKGEGIGLYQNEAWYRGGKSGASQVV